MIVERPRTVFGRRRSGPRLFDLKEASERRSLAVKPEITRRPCLGCGNLFWSLGINNRLCKKCGGVGPTP